MEQKDCENKDLVTSSLCTLSNYLLPELPFSSGCGDSWNVKVYYVSDIHLIHHLSKNVKDAFFDNTGEVSSLTYQSAKNQIKKYVKGLFDENFVRDIIKYEDRIIGSDLLILFGGDISSNTDLTKCFYHEFQIRYFYTLYTNWKESHYFNIYQLETEQEKLNYYRDYVIKREKERELHDKNNKENLRRSKCYKQSIADWDFDRSPQYPIFAILGNHELIDFPTVQAAVDNYESFFKHERICFLHNSFLLNYKYFIVGGIGFAKYNYKYNASSIRTTTPPMTREAEIEESENFYSVYEKALSESKKKYRHLIVLTHYPVNDWMPDNKTDSICSYFNGHNHFNKLSATNIYSDNQIGYQRKTIKLKFCYLGLYYNPFLEYEDGVYEITPFQYRMFMWYKGDPVQGTYWIEKNLSTGYANFYLIKQRGFYGFFIVNKKSGTKICVGGGIRNISPITDIGYFNKWFITVLTCYATAMAPYRKVQERIATDVKKLGYDGTIHGCIVDVDFHHHIMLDPISGKIAFYYSPLMGSMHMFGSFEKLIEHAKKENSSKLIVSSEERKELRKIGREQKKIIALYQEKPINAFLTLTDDIFSEDKIGKMVDIDIKNSTYAISSRINQLQRIFSSNILRAWDDNLVQRYMQSQNQTIENEKYFALNSGNEDSEKG